MAAAPLGQGKSVKLLKNIALIRAGVPFRKKVEPVESGRYELVQIKDVDRDRGVRMDSLVRVEAPEVSQSHLLQKGDVLFVARGARNDSVLFSSEMTNVVAGAQFFVIRPTQVVLPGYLAWYLNQEAAQRHVAEYSSGSHVPFVPKAALEELEVLLPPIEAQRTMVAIHSLSIEEQDLLEAIKAKRRELAEAVLQKMATRTLFADHMEKKYQ
jgi:hypothetical protein